MTDWEPIKEEVKKLLAADRSGHGFEHVNRVFRLAMQLAAEEKADAETVGLAALLHDCDDYKLFGIEAAEKLPNARRIMAECGIAPEVRERVLDIISRMGYSKSLKGIRPSSPEGRVVSDADMLDAMGASGIIRCLQYAFARCNRYGTPVFDPAIWPQTEQKAEEYQRPNRKNDNFINHFFEKLLKLKNMMMTDTARREAETRHKLMTDFLYHFFREENLPDWAEYLRNFEKNPDGQKTRE